MYRYDRLKYLVSGFLMALGVLGNSVVFGEDSKKLLSMEEIKQLITEFELVEKSLLNVQVDSEVWMEERESPSDSWERTLSHVSAKSFFSGFPIKKARVDVDSEITKGNWADQDRQVYSKKKYTSVYDGTIGRNIYYEYGDIEKVKKMNKGTIIEGPPRVIKGRRTGSVTGLRMTMIGFFSDREEIQSFSQYFKVAITPEAIQSNAFEFSRDECDGLSCIRFGMKASSSFRMNWWFDPARGYALLKYENIRMNQEGQEFIDERIHVQKLVKVSENHWWPVAGTIESDRRKPDKPFTRTVFRASNINVNDSALTEAVFNVPFPAGCLVEDKINNRTFKVPDDSRNK